MDIIIEIFLEIYMELMMLIVPEKCSDKKRKILATVAALLVLALIFALVIWGLTLIIDQSNFLGIIPIAFAIIISVVQIIFGIIFYNKNH